MKTLIWLIILSTALSVDSLADILVWVMATVILCGAVWILREVGRDYGI